MRGKKAAGLRSGGTGFGHKPRLRAGNGRGLSGLHQLKCTHTIGVARLPDVVARRL